MDIKLEVLFGRFLQFRWEEFLWLSNRIRCFRTRRLSGQYNRRDSIDAFLVLTVGTRCDLFCFVSQFGINILVCEFTNLDVTSSAR
jgi:hypothetical protein